MLGLPGAIVRGSNAMRIVPHGHLHDQYQRGEVLCPGLLSYAAGIIDKLGGFRVAVRENIADFEECGRQFWVARSNWRDLTSPYLIVRDPVPWNNIPWVIRECELAILWWIRTRNDPDWQAIPGLLTWLHRRNEHWIERVGRDEYAKQYRGFWQRDLGAG